MSTADLQRIADELYALPPDQFAAARDLRIRAARAERQPGLARELSTWRRPTQSAWLLNLLWRDQRDVMQQLFELADELQRAQADTSGPALRALTAQRRQLETALLRRARHLADQAGVHVTDAVEREASATLAAALARPEVAAEVRSGRLTRPATYAGFGDLPLSASPATADVRTGAAMPAATAGRAEPIELESARRARANRQIAEREADTARIAQQQRETAAREAAERRAAVRLELEQSLATARAAATEAAQVLDQRSRAADAAQTQFQELQRQVERLRQQLRQSETEAVAARASAEQAARVREEAERAHASALQALERAQRALASIADAHLP